MSTYYNAWLANEATGQQAIMLLAIMAVLLVAGWAIIPILLPKQYIQAARWAYIFCVLIMAVVTIQRV